MRDDQMVKKVTLCDDRMVLQAPSMSYSPSLVSFARRGRGSWLRTASLATQLSSSPLSRSCTLCLICNDTWHWQVQARGGVAATGMHMRLLFFYRFTASMWHRRALHLRPPGRPPCSTKVKKSPLLLSPFQLKYILLHAQVISLWSARFIWKRISNYDKL